MDMWGLLEYFFGYGNGRADHHAVPDEIARAGRDWTRRELRLEDIEVCFYRLILRLARVASEARERMGFVDD